MNLRDLADEKALVPDTLENKKEKAPTEPDHSQTEKWLVKKSYLLDGEQILLVRDRQFLKEARRTHPDKVIYFSPEEEDLCRHMDSPNYAKIVQKIHLVKKEFAGWIVPADTPLFQQVLDCTRRGMPDRGIHIM